MQFENLPLEDRFASLGADKFPLYTHVYPVVSSQFWLRFGFTEFAFALAAPSTVFSSPPVPFRSRYSTTSSSPKLGLSDKVNRYERS